MKAFVRIMLTMFFVGVCVAGCSQDDGQTVSDLNNEAIKLLNSDQPAQAVEKATSAFEKMEKENKTSHPDAVASLEIIGLSHQIMGNSTKAESAFLRALSIVKEFYGPNSSEAAKIMNNLGGLYFTQHQYILASSFFKQALDIVEKQFPADDPRLGVLQKNIDLCEAKQSGTPMTVPEADASAGQAAENKYQASSPVNLVEDLVPQKIKDSMVSQLSRQNIFISDLEPRQPVVVDNKGIVFPYHALKKGKDSDAGQEIVILFAAISNPDNPGAVIFQHCRLISHTSYLAALEKGGMPQLAKEIKEIFPDLYL